MALRAVVKDSFQITGRGTAVLLENGFDGNARRGDEVLVPLKDGGSRRLRVQAVEIADGKGAEGAPASWVGLVFGAGELDPAEVVAGGELRSA